MNPLEQVISIFFENGKTKFAIEILNQAKDFVNAPDQYFVLGFCYYKVAEYDLAIEMLNKCLQYRLDYEFTNRVYLQLALAHADKMDTEPALKYLEKIPQAIDISEILKEVQKRHKENKHIQSTGFWTDHQHHLHSNNLANWIIETLDKEENVVDLGCGLGFYLHKLERAKFKNLAGYEGEIPENKLFKNIKKQDLTKPFKIKNKANVICLEVAEHIPPEHAAQFLSNIEENCKGFLIMSWAVRGQMGIGHVNCKNNDEAIDLLKERGFEFLPQLTEQARSVINEECNWFKKSLLVFKKIS